MPYQSTRLGPCLIQDCPHPIHARGYCHTHYKRFMAGLPPALPSEEERFWTKVSKSDGWWEWSGGQHVAGGGFIYGVFYIRNGRGNGRQIKAQRYALQLKLGRPLRAGFFACHTCDNPLCVRPDHLFEGSPRDNSHDMAAKGRSTAGERHPSHTHPDRVPRGANHWAKRNPQLHRAKWLTEHGVVRWCRGDWEASSAELGDHRRRERWTCGASTRPSVQVLPGYGWRMGLWGVHYPSESD